jgi:rubredoxin
MVTVQTCSTLPEAQVIQSQLAGSGITAFLPDELTVQNDWLWTNAIGGVRVQVREEDVERASDILNVPSASAETGPTRICPQCGMALKKYYGWSLYPKILGVLLFSIPLRTKPSLKCPGCGWRFDKAFRPDSAS